MIVGSPLSVRLHLGSKASCKALYSDHTSQELLLYVHVCIGQFRKEGDNFNSCLHMCTLSSSTRHTLYSKSISRRVGNDLNFAIVSEIAKLKIQFCACQNVSRTYRLLWRREHVTWQKSNQTVICN